MVKPEQSSASSESRHPRSFGSTEYILATVVGVLVLALAALGGRHVAFDSSITLHGVIANGVFTLQGILILLLVVRRASTSVKVIAALFFVLLVAQIGLGYSARSTHGTVAVHIPLGAALFGLAGLQIDRIYQATRRPRLIR